MEANKRKNQKRVPMNPNWAQLQQILKSGTLNNASTQGVCGKRKRDTDVSSTDSQPNPLLPVNDDFSITDIVAMDCEMVGVGFSNKSALARVTLVNQWGNILLDEFVKPLEQVHDFRTRISGIRPRDLKKAKHFPSVQRTVANIIKGRILVGHALHNDLKALLLSHPKQDIRDTSEYKPFLRGGKSKALKRLAMEFIGVSIQNGEHCSVEDARAALLLYQRNKIQWEKNLKNQKQLHGSKKQKNKRKSPTSNNHLLEAS